jgi:hypothetical protein
VEGHDAPRQFAPGQHAPGHYAPRQYATQTLCHLRQYAPRQYALRQYANRRQTATWRQPATITKVPRDITTPVQPGTIGHQGKHAMRDNLPPVQNMPPGETIFKVQLRTIQTCNFLHKFVLFYLVKVI